MKLMKTLTALAVAATLTACGGVDQVSRNAPLDAGQLATPQVAIAPNFTLSGVSVGIPQDLRVSEANRYYPVADIVWRGDGLGDRKQQIARIFQESLAGTASRMTGDQSVDVEITINRFHSVTEKARWTFGGVHNIRFDMVVRDAVNGQVLLTRNMNADLPAFGGEMAARAEAAGETQKVRITRHLTEVITDALIAQPVRYES